jgi:hypothetical protein
MWLHAWACTISKLDRDLRSGASGQEFQRNRAAAIHFFDLAEHAILDSFKELTENSDDTMPAAAKAELDYSATLPNSEYVIHEASPNAKGTGRMNKQAGIKQFPGDSRLPRGASNDHGNGNEAAARDLRSREHTEVH